MFPIVQVIFFVFAALLVGAATAVILSRNSVRAILFLVLAFFASSVLWMLLQAEFLSLVLIFVYVGAVMTLFLFVVMMLNVDLDRIKEQFARYLPFGLLAMILLMAILGLVINPHHFIGAGAHFPVRAPDYNNTVVMGTLLYTQYLYPFEIAGVILLVAIVSSITLAFYGRKSNTKTQSIREQHEATKRHRLRVVKMKSEKP